MPEAFEIRSMKLCPAINDLVIEYYDANGEIRRATYQLTPSAPIGPAST